MTRVYLLPIIDTPNGASVVGSVYIHDALLSPTIDLTIMKLIMDTTDDEHVALVTAGAVPAAVTQADIDAYNSQVIFPPPDPDALRAQELLATSPAVITQPEMWELMRIYGRRLGLSP